MIHNIIEKDIRVPCFDSSDYFKRINFASFEREPLFIYLSRITIDYLFL